MDISFVQLGACGACGVPCAQLWSVVVLFNLKKTRKHLAISCKLQTNINDNILHLMIVHYRKTQARKGEGLDSAARHMPSFRVTGDFRVGLNTSIKESNYIVTVPHLYTVRWFLLFVGGSLRCMRERLHTGTRIYLHPVQWAASKDNNSSRDCCPGYVGHYGGGQLHLPGIVVGLDTDRASRLLRTIS